MAPIVVEDEDTVQLSAASLPGTHVALVAGKILDDRTVETTFPENPDGKYLLKGGTPSVWEEFRLPDKWRSRLGEGVIKGKRCGMTQDIGPAARRRRSLRPQIVA